MRFGIVCALLQEARAFIPAGAIPTRAPIRLRGGATLVVCGMGAANAAAATRLALEQAPDCVISFGLAGALSPRLPPGAVVAPAAVVDGRGERHSTDNAYRAALLQSLRRGCALPQSDRAAPIHTGPLLCADTPVTTPAGKQALFAQHGCGAVDLESAAIAATAAAHGAPALAARIILDSAATSLPPPVTAHTDAFGRVDFYRLPPALLRRPAAIPAVLRLALEWRAARKSMRRVARQILSLAAES